MVCVDGDDKVDVHPSVWRGYPWIACCWGSVGRGFSWSSDLPHLFVDMERPRPSPHVIYKMSQLMKLVLPMGSILGLTCIMWEEEDWRRSLGVFVGLVHRGGVCGYTGRDPVESVGPGSKLRLVERWSFTYLGLLNNAWLSWGLRGGGGV